MTLMKTVEQRTNDFGPREADASLAAKAHREAVERKDLPLEEHDGDLRPRFAMDSRATAAAFLGGVVRSCGFELHAAPKAALCRRLLLAQTRQQQLME
jgi:hypothetical protein